MTRLHAWWIGMTLWAALALAVNARAENPPAAPLDSPVELELELRAANGSADYDLSFENVALFAEPALFAQNGAKPMPREVPSWGMHPASPTPGYSARWMLLNDAVRPVSASDEKGEKKTVGRATLEVELNDDEQKCPLCPTGKAHCCEDEKTANEPQPSEAAKIILDVMDSVGRSVLDGTVFRKPDPDNEKWLKHIDESKELSPRQALIQYIRALEAERSRQTTAACQSTCPSTCQSSGSSACQTACPSTCQAASPLVCQAACPSTCQMACQAGCPANCQQAAAPCQPSRDCTFNITAIECRPGEACDGCPCDNCPLGVACQQCPCPASMERIGVDFDYVVQPNPPSNKVEALKETWQSLEMLAAGLEEQELYDRADQLREMACQLRSETRAAKAGPQIRMAPQTTWYQAGPQHAECVTWAPQPMDACSPQHQPSEGVICLPRATGPYPPAPGQPAAMMPIPRVYFHSAPYTLPLPAPPTQEQGLQAEVERLRQQLHQAQQALEAHGPQTRY